ncbi:hypothetical protein niasHT_037302 [Heterodera trifolii]|uniref:Uncharacterized protein n=1 Tax=Heterodera trifolii TaxID=157864 RepID=A0ABD2J202_9BILA
MGKEKNFLKSLTINRKQFSNIYLPKSMPRANDLAFATTACDSLLITAQTSSFSWWIAYLMPDNATIFYNSKITKNVYTTNENFLAEWVPIELVNGNISVHLTHGDDGFKEVQLCPLAQCHADNDGPNEIAKIPYGIEFQCGNCEEGILICYRALLQRGNHLDNRRNSKVKRKFIVDAKMGIEKECLEKLPKDGNANGTIIWRAIKLRTIPKQTKNNNDKETSIILESSIASKKFYTLGAGNRQFSLLFDWNKLFKPFSRFSLEEKDLDGRAMQNDFLRSNGPSFLSDYADLWLLALDMLPMAHHTSAEEQSEQLKMELFISRSSNCSMEAWFVQPSNSVRSSDPKMPFDGSVCKLNPIGRK